jgi:hypothetical protein
MAKAAKQRKAKKPVAKAAVRKPKPKPRRKPMATDQPKADTRTTVTPAMMPPAEAMTEQEKDTKAGGSGVGPVAASEPPPPLETMEDLGIGPREPYPSADTPPAARNTAQKEVKK